MILFISNIVEKWLVTLSNPVVEVFLAQKISQYRRVIHTTPAALPNQMLLIACVCCFCHLCMFVHVKSKIRAAKEARCHYLEGSKTIITSSWNLLFEFQIIVSIFCQAKVANGPLHVASFVHGKIIKSEKWQINWITYEYLLMSVDFSWHVSLNLICTKNANMDCLDYVGNRNTCVNVG